MDRILSFSFSKNTIAYCITNGDKIEYWDLIEILDAFDIHIKSKRLYKKLNSMITIFDDIKYVLIDKSHKKLTEIETLIYSYFRILKMNIEIKLINTKYKLDIPDEGVDIPIPNKYKMKGSLATAYCDYYIAGTEWENYYNGYQFKDDLAQAYIQILQFKSVLRNNKIEDNNIL